ncbi:MAG: CIA30 family protein [Pseudomonadota bacterium]|nr:CIA30 family protein [Pseudomonadota bacterium]
MALTTKIAALGLLIFAFLAGNGIAGERYLDTINDQKVSWEFFTDGVMGGKSVGKAEFVEEGSQTFIRMSGEVTTENNGGFIQIRAKVSELSDKTNGISIKVRGNNEKYYIFLRTSGTLMPWQYYSAEFSTTDRWTLLKVALTDFKRSSIWLKNTIDGSAIKSIGIVAYGRKHNALIEIAEVRTY